MKKTLIASAGVTVCLCLSATAVMACGDKLLYLNRIYFHRASANSTVAIFSHPNSLLENAARLNLAKAFDQDGYHLLLVNNGHDLALALQSGAADVVIADMTDVASIQMQFKEAKIPIIPVVGQEGITKPEAKRFVATITAPLKTDKILDALEKAFDSRGIRSSQAKTEALRISAQ